MSTLVLLRTAVQDEILTGTYPLDIFERGELESAAKAGEILGLTEAAAKVERYLDDVDEAAYDAHYDGDRWYWG